MAFYKLNDEKWQNHRHSFRGTTPKEFSFKLDCVAGKILKCDAVAEALIEGRHFDEVSFVDLTTTGINLTEWAGERETFVARITPDTLTAHIVREWSFKLV